MERSAIRQSVVMGLGVVLMSLGSPALARTPARSTARDQALMKTRPVAIEGVPRSIMRSAVTADGDLLIMPTPTRSARVQPARIISASGMYRVSGFSLGDSLSRLGVSDMALSSADAVWVLTRKTAMVRDSGAWSKVKLGLMDGFACRDVRRLRLDAACQRIVPTTPGRAIVFRVEYVPVPGEKRRQLGTRIYAVAVGKDQPVASLEIPGFVFGPAVPDGQGGFWSVIQKIPARGRRVSMRGYVRYTKDARWLLWLERGQGVPGLKLRGKTPFIISSDTRKLSADGAGGFYTVGADRFIYHVRDDGTVQRFGNAAICQYCQNVSLTFDRRGKALHVLSAEWREGGAGQRELVKSLVWKHYTAAGLIEAQTPVPLPDRLRKPGTMRRAQRAFHDQVQVHAAGGQVWIVGPGVLLHRDGKQWTYLTDAKTVERIDLANRDAARRKKGKSPIPGTVAVIEGAAGAGLLLGAIVAASKQDRAGDIGVATYGTLFGMGLSYFPATWFYPFLVDTGDPSTLRTTCLTGGSLGVPLMSATGVWAAGRLVSRSSDDPAGGREFLGALGGAALGTAASSLLTWQLLANDHQQEWKESTVVLLGAFLVNSAAVMGYQMARGKK